jgi:hypothetical protein
VGSCGHASDCLIEVEASPRRPTHNVVLAPPRPSPACASCAATRCCSLPSFRPLSYHLSSTHIPQAPQDDAEEHTVLCAFYRRETDSSDNDAYSCNPHLMCLIVIVAGSCTITWLVFKIPTWCFYIMAKLDEQFEICSI